MKNVFLISPSGHLSKEKFNNSLKNLKKWGFGRIKYLKSINSKFYYYAGDYERRYNEVNQAYKDEETEIVFCARGGMGAVQLISFLDYNMIRKSGKVLIGFSDATILLNSIYQKTSLRCLHGPMPCNKNYDRKTISCLHMALNKEDYSVRINEKDVFKEGFAKAKIVGGAIRVLVKSLGGEHEIQTSDKILFLEQNHWRGRDIYDALWQLKLAGKFKKVKGIILGYFTKCDEPVLNYLKDFFKDFKCPIIFNQPIGHKEPNLTIPIGEICIINTEKLSWQIKF
jgi:muramoyltetrapeptide carboxypeptidase